jgi:hypothetical protein
LVDGLVLQVLVMNIKLKKIYTKVNYGIKKRRNTN